MSSLATIRRPAAALALAALLLATSAASADPPATTQPDKISRLTPAQLRKLEAVAQKAVRYRWSDPVVEEFAKQPAKPSWLVQEMAKITYADGRMHVQPTQGQQRFGAVCRPLPEAVRGHIGLRIDLWCTVPKVDANCRLILILNENRPTQLRWDYAYYFSYARNGQQQQFARWYRQGRFEGNSFMDKPLQADKLVHVSLQAAAGRISLQRDDNRDYTRDVKDGLVIGQDTHVGLAAYRGQMDVVRIDYRAMVVESTDDAAIWKDTPFAGRAQFDRWVSRELIGGLSNPAYEVRQRSTAALQQLGPLVVDQVREAMTSSANDEVKLRLESLLAAPINVKIPALTEEQLNAPRLNPPATQPQK